MLPHYLGLIVKHLCILMESASTRAHSVEDDCYEFSVNMTTGSSADAKGDIDTLYKLCTHQVIHNGNKVNVSCV